MGREKRFVIVLLFYILVKLQYKDIRSLNLGKYATNGIFHTKKINHLKIWSRLIQLFYTDFTNKINRINDQIQNYLTKNRLRDGLSCTRMNLRELIVVESEKTLFDVG